MTEDCASQQRRPRSEGHHLVSQPVTKPPTSPVRRPSTTPKLRIQRVLSQSSASPPRSTTSSSSSSSAELFRMTKLSDSPPKPPAILMDDEVSETSIDNNDELKATSESDNDDVPPVIQMVPTTLTPQVPTEWADQDDSPYENPVDGNTESRAALSVAQTSPPARLAHVQPSTRQEENVCKAESSTVQSHLSTSGDGDGMYVQWRKQMDMAEAARHKVQADLTEYLASLATKQDDSGSSLVTFPDNYHTVLKLMTKADLGPTAPTWSKALLEDGLAKKQAHGVLQHDDDVTAPTALNVKIAHGIAQIRTFDAKLDALDLKLKNQTKTKAFMTPGVTPTVKTSSAQRIKDKVEAAKTMGETTDFISRNKQMKEAGSSLTKAEATRVETLLDTPVAGEVAHEDGNLLLNPFDCMLDDRRVDEIDLSLQAMQAKRAATPMTDDEALPSLVSSMAHLNTTQRLAAIDCALQSFRDDADDLVVGGVDDDSKSVRSDASSVWSTASSRTVTKRDLRLVTAQAKLEVPETETAPREAINHLLATLAGIAIEIADDDDDEQPQVDASIQPQKPIDGPDISTPSRTRRTRPTKPPPSSSSFSHLFTLPFEASQLGRKHIAHSTFR